MKPEQLVALLVRLFAVALFLYTLRYVPSLMEGSDASILAAGALTLAMFLVAVLLWMFPLTVATNILPVVDEKLDRRVTESELYGCGFVLLGLYFLFYSASDGLYLMLSLFATGRDPSGLFRIGTEGKFMIAVTAIEIIASLAVILGSRGLTRLVFRLRYGNVAQ